MATNPSLPLAASLVAALVSSGALAAPALPACEGIAALSLPDTTITVAAPVAAGTMPPIDTAACRVAGTIKPTSDSKIAFEVWLPIDAGGVAHTSTLRMAESRRVQRQGQHRRCGKLQLPGPAGPPRRGR